MPSSLGSLSLSRGSIINCRIPPGAGVRCPTVSYNLLKLSEHLDEVQAVGG